MAELVRSWREGKPQTPLSPLGLTVVVAVIAMDQVSKLLALSLLPLREPVDLLPILTLYRVENTGIAFSLFSGSGFPLIVLTLAISLVVIAFWLRATEGGTLAAIGFALILGGAVGNLIDRIRLGSVVDFLLLHFGSRTLFIFNLADAALTLGPLCLIAVYFKPRSQ